MSRDPTVLQKRPLPAASFPEDEVYCAPVLSGIILEPIRDTRPPEYFKTPRYKRWLTALRARRKHRTTFKQRMRDCWHEKACGVSADDALATLHRRKK